MSKEGKKQIKWIEKEWEKKLKEEGNKKGNKSKRIEREVKKEKLRDFYLQNFSKSNLVT